MTDSSNKRIAKNTIFLYIRMMLLIGVNFYTTRVVLEALGVNDYGLYNVVAGFVAMVTFINQSMTSSIQRFLNYEMGTGNQARIKEIFSSALAAQFLLVGLIFIFAESIGLWFVNYKLQISPHQIIAANIVYQTSIFTVFINIYRSAFNAVIIAEEKMQFYAFISLVEGLLQLGIAFLLLLSVNNRLILYGILLLAVALFTGIFYVIYAKRLMPDITFKHSFNSRDLKQLSSFCGWNILGSGAGILKSQGINILMNLFFGVTINAARGIAVQLQTCIFKLASNFQVAIYPQIVQSYARKEISRYFDLCYLSYKMSIYLMWLVTLPLMICTPSVLNLWLGDNVPPFTVIFTRLILLTALIDILGAAISTPIYATGNIKEYQIKVSGIILCIIPITWLSYKIGLPPQAGMYVSLFLSIFAQYYRVRIWCTLVNENIKSYMTRIALPALLIIAISSVLSWGAGILMGSSFLGVIGITLTSIIINCILFYYIGLNSKERETLNKTIKQKINNRKNKIK